MAITAIEMIGLGMPPALAKYLADGITFGDAAQQAVIADLAGTLTGTIDGTLADVGAVAIVSAGGNTYADTTVNTAVNVAVTSLNVQLKECQAKINAALGALRTAGIIAT